MSISAPTTASFLYDADGTRVKSVLGGVTTKTPTTWYNVAGTTPTKHILLPDGEMLATVEGSNASATISYIHTDHLTGSGLVTNSSGAQTQLLDYHPWGTIRINNQSSTFNEKRKFAGHEYDAETGLSYMVARYYEPGTGRFLSEDPVFINVGTGDKRDAILLLDPQMMNSYLYGRGNPIAFRDDSGEFAETVLDIISTAISAYDFHRNPSWANGFFLGLDGVGGFTPFLPSVVGYVRHSADVARIGQYFADVAKHTGRAGDVARSAGLFVRNIGFEFTGRAWSSGRAGNDIANLVGHFVKHGDEPSIGATSVSDYYNKANDFVNNHKGFNDPLKNNGDQIHWDPKTNVKAVTTNDGSVRSYYTEHNQSKIQTYNSKYGKK